MKIKQFIYTIASLLIVACALLTNASSFKSDVQEDGVTAYLDAPTPSNTFRDWYQLCKPEGYVDGTTLQAQQGVNTLQNSEQETTDDSNPGGNGHGHCHFFHNKQQQTLLRVARRESMPHNFSVSRKYYVIALRRILI